MRIAYEIFIELGVADEHVQCTPQYYHDLVEQP